MNYMLRRLNVIKIVNSREERDKLISEGYEPVEKAVKLEFKAPEKPTGKKNSG